VHTTSTYEENQFSFGYTQFLYSFQSVTSSLRHPSRLAFAVGHAVVFAVNAALVASYGQHCA